MLYNILNYLLFSADGNITKILIIGTLLYGLIFTLSYTKYTDNIPYLKQYRKYIIHVAIIDMLLFFIVNRSTIVKKIKNKETKHEPTLINNYSESESEDIQNPYNKEHKQQSPFIPIDETESDIEFPIYKSQI